MSNNDRSEAKAQGDPSQDLQSMPSSPDGGTSRDCENYSSDQEMVLLATDAMERRSITQMVGSLR